MAEVHKYETLKYLQGKILTSLFLNLFTGKLALTNLFGLAFILAKR